MKRALTLKLTLCLVEIFESEIKVDAPQSSPYFSVKVKENNARFYVGDIPAEVLVAVRLSRALGHQVASVLAPANVSWDESVAFQSKWPDNPRESFTTLVAEGSIDISEADLVRGPELLHLSPEADQRIRTEIESSLEPLLQSIIPIVSAAQKSSYFSKLVARHSLGHLDEELVLFLPKLKMTARGTVISQFSLPDPADLEKAVVSYTVLDKSVKNDLANAYRWHLLSLAQDDRWKLFQFAFLAIERLVEALVFIQPLEPTERDSAKKVVLSVEASLGILRNPGDRPSPVTVNYAGLALRFHGAEIENRVRFFILDREARNAMAHGSVDARDDGEPSHCLQLYEDLQKVAISKLVGLSI